jgi:hypothetical protein
MDKETLPAKHVRRNWSELNLKGWLRKLGFWGLVFFVLKGLLWIAIPALVALFAAD